MLVFDTHTHVFPDKIAVAAVASLREKSHQLPAYTDGTYGGHRQKCLEAGYAGWMNCPVCTRPGQASHANQWAAQHNAGPGYSLGGMHPDEEDISGTVRQLMELGLYGVKFHPEYQAFSLLEPRMERVWNCLEENGVPVLFHAGQDVGFLPPYHSTFADFITLAKRHPGLRMIAGHLGGWGEWDTVEKLCCAPPGGMLPSNLYLDTAFVIPPMKDSMQLFRIARAIGTDHVLFGTDSPWSELKDALQRVQALPFSEEERRDILWNNAVRFWHLPLKTIDKEGSA